MTSIPRTRDNTHSLLYVTRKTMSLDVPAFAATGGAGTTGAAGGAAAGATAAPPPVPATFPEKLALAKALRDDNTARFAKLRTAPPAPQHKICVDRVSVTDFKVVQKVEKTPVSELLAAWRGPIELTPIPDTFNDKLDYGVNSWAKLEALSINMLPVMEKYEMLQQDSPKVVAATTAFVTNYHAIGAALAATEARAAGSVSRLDAVKAQLAELSARITAVVAGAGGVIGPAPSDTVIQLPGITPAHEAVLRDALRAAGVAAPRFELLYQASVDGVTAADVLRACAGNGPVLMIGREATGGWLFGGYMDCGMASDIGTLTAPQSFVFTLTNPHGVPPIAWRRGDGDVGDGVYRNPRDYCLCWNGVLGARAPSVLRWHASAPPPGYYEPLGDHKGNVFTGSADWDASDVVIFRVVWGSTEATLKVEDALFGGDF